MAYPYTMEIGQGPVQRPNRNFSILQECSQDTDSDQDPLFPIVPVLFPVPAAVALQRSVNKP